MMLTEYDEQATLEKKDARDMRMGLKKEKEQVDSVLGIL